MGKEPYFCSRRNRVILSAVLRGWTLNQVASIYGITNTRVKQISMKTVKTLYPEYYEQIMAKHSTGSIKEARKYKYRMLPFIQFLTEAGV